MITSSSLYPLSVLTGSHIDFVSLRVLALPGLYLRDKSNCLSLDRLLPLLPSVSLCAKICQVKSLHILKSRSTTCRSAEHYRWLTYQQTLPHGMLQPWQHNTLAKNIHKPTYNVITLWRHNYTQWQTKHESLITRTDFWYLCVLKSQIAIDGLRCTKKLQQLESFNIWLKTIELLSVESHHRKHVVKCVSHVEFLFLWNATWIWTMSSRQGKNNKIIYPYNTLLCLFIFAI